MFGLLEKLPVRGEENANSTSTKPQIKTIPFIFIYVSIPYSKQQLTLYRSAFQASVSLICDSEEGEEGTVWAKTKWLG